MWQRWNGTTKIFEKSADNGVVWTPLGLDATIITQGAFINASVVDSIYIATSNYFNSLPGIPGAPIIGEIRAQYPSSNNRGLLRLSAGGGATDSLKAGIDIQGYGDIDSNVIRFFTYGAECGRFRSDGAFHVGGPNTPSALGFGGRLAANFDRNSLTAIAVVNQTNGAAAQTGIILSSAGNSWTIGMGSVAKNGNTMTWELDMTSPVVKMSLDTSGRLTVVGGFVMAVWQTTVAPANVYTADASVLYRSTSSLRFKTDIETIGLALAKRVIESLRPITYRGKTESDNKRRYAGFGAEEVEKLEPVLVTYDEGGEPEYVTYDRVPAYIVPVVQDHESRLAAIEQRLEKR